jgi:hypothetical protein
VTPKKGVQSVWGMTGRQKRVFRALCREGKPAHQAGTSRLDGGHYRCVMWPLDSYKPRTCYNLMTGCGRHQSLKAVLHGRDHLRRDAAPRAQRSCQARHCCARREKRGAFALEASVSGYCKHLRDMASTRGGEDAVAVRTKLASAQADLATEKVKAMRGETSIPQREKALDSLFCLL